MKKLLVTGVTGMLGNAVVKELGDRYEIYGFARGAHSPASSRFYKIDITDKISVEKAIRQIDPDRVVHCAAMTNADACEYDYALAHAVNGLGTLNMVKSCGRRTNIIYISTDSVFDGKCGMYKETDLPFPLNNYARTKLEGETFVEKESENYSIIRTNMFGWGRASLAVWVYDNLKLGKSVDMFTDVIFSPLEVNTISHYIGMLCDSGFTGRVNIGSRNPVSKFDFGRMLAKQFRFEEALVKPAELSKAKLRAPRPKNTSLDIANAEKILGKMPTVEEELEKFYDLKGV